MGPGAIVGAVAFDMPAFAKHRIHQVIEILVVEDIEVFAGLHFQFAMLVVVGDLVTLVLSLALFS
jgi:hypothetical protein